MIKAIVGTVGSGKSLYATKQILERGQHTFVNYKVRLPETYRIKLNDVLKEKTTKTKTKPKKELSVNWDFWNNAVKKYKGFDICLDEFQTICNSRMGMKKTSILLTIWISQIRKILGEKEKNHFFLITQRLNRVDVAFRDLLDEIIYCVKYQMKEKIKTVVYENGKKIIKLLPKTFILLFFFLGENCMESYNSFRLNPRLKFYKRRAFFLGNPYFRYYDSFELVRFGEDIYL